MQIKKIHIGKLLLENKLITQEQLDQAITQQNLTGQRLGQTLIDLHFIDEDKLLNLLAQQLNIPFINLKDYSLRHEVVIQLPEIYARNFRAIILSEDIEGYFVGMADPQDIISADELERILKKPLRFALVREQDLLDAIDLLYRKTSEISSFAEELSVEMDKNEFNIASLTAGLSETDAPVAKLLESIFEDAIMMNASDIHIEPDEKMLRIRQRIDGMLHEQIINEKQIAQALTSRLKLMAGIDITEKRLPQDGRFTINVKNKNYDVRLSTLPVQYGEAVVMRILGQGGTMKPLGKIAMPPEILAHLRRIIHMPYGILLITGPTGSGKTTTLYGALTELNTPEKKILTVEDPVEYRVSRLNQVQINPKIDLTFARTLRAFLRQDPDIIMIGELRDKETAEIALRAAMTGHFVLSTLHTNDAISSAIRLIDMGAEGYLVAAVVRGIIAQRLVRRICENCIRDYEPSTNEKVWLKGAASEEYTSSPYKVGSGCSYCRNTGYRGQIGVFELLELTPELADLLRRSDTSAFAEAARKHPSFQPLIKSGLALATKGITTIAEIMRIIGENIAAE